MEEMKRIKKSLNPYKTLDLKSKLGINGIDRFMETARKFESAGLKYDSLHKNHISEFQGAASKAAYISHSMKMDNFSRIAYAGKALDFMSQLPITQLKTSIETAGLLTNQMSIDLTKNYGSMLRETALNISETIEKLKYSYPDYINGLITEIANNINNIDISEFNEELEEEIDSQEVESIVNAEIEEAILVSKEQGNDIIIAIEKINETIEKNNSKGGLLNKVVSKVLEEVIVKILVFIIVISNAYTPTNADINHTINSTKQIVQTMDIDDSFYNTVRIVVKDELEVRRSNKMKSGVKYFLDFGDLVKIEYKNKNWTKISYTNVYTDEKEVGWVLTRYIKRLD